MGNSVFVMGKKDLNRHFTYGDLQVANQHTKFSISLSLKDIKLQPYEVYYTFIKWIKFKTLMTPIRMFRMYKDLVDLHSCQVVRHTVYTTIIPVVFNNCVNCMYYLMANFGPYYTMDFLDIHCVQVDDKPVDRDDWYNFEKNGIYISYPKSCGQDPMVQAFVVTLYEGIGNGTTVDDLFNVRHWITLLGASFNNASIDKGLFILDALDGTYDIVTHEDLHLPEEQKADIYCIIRYLENR